ncbi:hypothetical protein ACLOJK_009626 [Asimina triloba]
MYAYKHSPPTSHILRRHAFVCVHQPSHAYRKMSRKSSTEHPYVSLANSPSLAINSRPPQTHVTNTSITFNSPASSACLLASMAARDISSSILFSLSLSLSLLVLWHGCAAAEYSVGGPYRRPQQRFRQQAECRLQSISQLKPNREAQAEAGKIQYYDESNDQLDCAGVSVVKYIINPNGLLLPSYDSAPGLAYIIQGEGLAGTIVPGCPETYQSRGGQRQEEGEGESEDEHQKVRRFRRGDAYALSEAVAHWFYNHGKEDVVILVVLDTSNPANQLNQNLRTFRLAGAHQVGDGQQGSEQQQQQQQARCVFSGLDLDLLAEVLGVSRETAKKLQDCEDFEKGPIVNVKNGLRLVTPSTAADEEGQGRRGLKLNGLEEAFCNARIKENIDRPNQADVYNPRAGRITILNSHKLPILGYLGLNAERLVLYRNALVAPHWHINAHSVIYCTGGNARVQIVGNDGKAVFDGQLRKEELVVVPQGFVLLIQAGDEGFEYVAIKTNDNALTSPIVGQTSVIRAIPNGVLRNSYQITDDEAQRLKHNRGREPIVMESRSQEQGRASA